MEEDVNLNKTRFVIVISFFINKLNKDEVN